MVLVAENYAYKPLAKVLQDVIGSGEIGDVRFVLLNALKYRRASDWRDDAELAGGGALFEGGVHWIDLLANLGLTVESVQGYWPGDQRGDERSMAVVAQYEEGGVGVLLHSWETPSLLRGAPPVQGDRGPRQHHVRVERSVRAHPRPSAAPGGPVAARCRAATARCCATSCGCSPRAASRS